MSTAKIILQAASVTTSLVSAGGIASLSLFDIPELRAQPASRSLPSVRWLFSRGSYIFPAASLAANSTTVNLYLAAAAINAGNLVWTSAAMTPTNLALIELNETIGGTRSAQAAHEQRYGAGGRTAEDSVNGKGDSTSQLRDLSGPQTKSDRQSTPEEDQHADALLAKFGQLNAVRSLFPGVGGVVGLLAALL